MREILDFFSGKIKRSKVSQELDPRECPQDGYRVSVSPVCDEGGPSGEV